MHILGVFFGDFPHVYAMLYTKMFHGRDKMKHVVDACEYHTRIRHMDRRSLKIRSLKISRTSC